MSTVVSDPWRSIRDEIEAAAQNNSLSADARIGLLRTYRDDLNDLLGRVDTYTGDLELVREARSPAYAEMVLEAREDADLRGVLLDRGLATPEELDALGYLSHDDLDKLAEEALLEPWLYERARDMIEALPGEDVLRKAWEEMKHPRGAHGKFRDVLGRAVHPRGRRGAKVAIPRAPGGGTPQPPTPSPTRVGPPMPHHPAHEVDQTPPPAEAVVRDLEWARQHGLNDWPTKGDKATEILGDAADTQDLHTRIVKGAGSNRQYSDERAALHDKIVDTLLRKRQPVEKQNPDGSQKLDEHGLPVIEMHPHAEGEYLTAAPGKPAVLMMAGGTASGKSTALALPENAGETPEDAVHIDPDEIKAMIPEYNQMVQAGDKFAASGVHEESSDISKRLLAEAMKRGLNIVRDGTGNSPGPKFGGQIRDMVNAGYDVRVFYVNAPTDLAIVRATSRAQRSGRWVPEPEIRNQHTRVSQRFVEHVRPLVEDGTISHIAMWQTEGAPTKFAEGGGGQFSVVEPDLYQRFVDKAQEGEH